MKTPKHLNQKGFSHFLVPLLIIVAVAIGGTYMLVSSHAATPYRIHKYSKTQKQTFALAASNYWNNPKRIDQGYNAQAYIYDINHVSCTPGKVKLLYINDSSKPEIAHVTGTYVQGVYYPPAVKIIRHKGDVWTAADRRAASIHNSKYYCKMVFNLAYQYQIPSTALACTVYIHEYGHMLGRNHNTNPDSPMYTGYVVGHGGGSESFYPNKLTIIKRSLCSPRSVGL